MPRRMQTVNMSKRVDLRRLRQPTARLIFLNPASKIYLNKKIHTECTITISLSAPVRNVDRERTYIYSVQVSRYLTYLTFYELPFSHIKAVVKCKELMIKITLNKRFQKQPIYQFNTNT